MRKYALLFTCLPLSVVFGGVIDPVVLFPKALRESMKEVDVLVENVKSAREKTREQLEILRKNLAAGSNEVVANC